MSVGGNLVFGTGDSYTNIGIGADFRYQFLDKVRGSAELTYFFPKDYVSMVDFSVNAHYLFPITGQITVYPLAGLGILQSTVDYGDVFGVSASSSHSDVAFNIGGGADYYFTDKLIFNAELKYKISDTWDRALLSLGVKYKF